MPTVLRVKGYQFYFVSYDCREPHHVHIDKDGNTAKFWLNPLTLAKNGGFRSVELREIERIIQDYHADLVAAWDAFCP